jgi:hypothetical protein
VRTVRFREYGEPGDVLHLEQVPVRYDVLGEFARNPAARPVHHPHRPNAQHTAESPWATEHPLMPRHGLVQRDQVTSAGAPTFRIEDLDPTSQ